MRSIKSIARQLSFATGVAAALSISSCGPAPQEQVCADRDGKRIPDDNCRRTNHAGVGAAALGAYWLYGSQARQTRMGERVSNATRTPSRGGFGSYARGSSGG